MANSEIHKEKSLMEIRHSPEFGRYLISAQDIEALTVVLSESPLTFGPGDDDQEVNLGEIPMCLSCCERMIQNPMNKCSKCAWPVCGESCQNMDIHSRNECDLFTKLQVTYPPPHTWPIINKSILALRILLLKENDPESWENIIDALEHHTEIRLKRSYCVKGDEMLMDNMKHFLNACQEFDQETKRLILKVSGVINVNAFSTTNFHSKSGHAHACNSMMIAQCVYKTASLFCNSCVPNCTWRVGPSPTFKINVRSTIRIKKGEIITIAYCPHDILCGTLQRQISSDDVALFICRCVRCKDPSELNTFLSAILCPVCNTLVETNGFLLPVNPLQPESSWQCCNKNCQESQSVHKIVALLLKIQGMFEEIKHKGLRHHEEIEALENFISYAERVLHSNHYLILDVKMHIIKMEIPLLNYIHEEQLFKVIRHTKILLKIANTLAPGFSQIRALLQHFFAQELTIKLEKGFTDLEYEENSTKQFIQYLETKALSFFQSHNYQAENDKIIKSIKTRLQQKLN